MPSVLCITHLMFTLQMSFQLNFCYKKKPEEGDFDDDRCKRSVSFEGWLDIDTKERGKVGDKLKCRFVHCLIYTSRLGIKNYFNTKSFFMLQNKFI